MGPSEESSNLCRDIGFHEDGGHGPLSMGVIHGDEEDLTDVLGNGK